MPFAPTEIRRHHGVPTLFVDGRPLHGMTATSCAFQDPRVVRDFVAGGTEILMIWIEAGIHCWKGPGRYDWSYAEEKLKHFEAHGGDTKWILRTRLGLLDPWFAKAHPLEVHNPPDVAGRPQGDLSVANIASSVWCREVCGLLESYTRWVEGTRWAPRVIGFMLNAGATEEWLMFNVAELFKGNYGACVTREFRRWLRRRYGDDLQALRAAWRGGDGLTFDTAEGPKGMVRKGSHIWGPFSLRDPLLERQAIDYYGFLNEQLSDHLIAFCRTVKQAARTNVLCGGFHSYLWWETGVYSYIQEYGHAYLQRLLASPHVDFVSDITSYDGRYPGGPSGYLGVPHSFHLRDKLHYTEVDLTTIHQLEPEYREAWSKVDPATIPAGTAEPAIPDRVWKWDKGFCGRDIAEQIAVLQREHLHNLITASPYWWFDIRQHDYQAPEIVAALARLSQIGRAATEWDRASLSEVAFVLSEDTPMFQAAMNGELLRFELESNHRLLLDGCHKQWGLAGVPFDFYELHDLAHPVFPGRQYKLLIFVNCAHIPAAAAEGIRRWQRDGRVFCWTYAAGVTDWEGLDPGRNAELLGVRLGWHNRRRNIRVEMEAGDHPLTRGSGALDFGTEGSVGPVFFADDPRASVLGRLRDGGEAAFVVREHDNWRAAYLAMLNFGPQLLRNLAAYAGGHVWCESNDVLYANRSLLCLHSATGGEKRVRLPAPARLTDLWTGERTAEPVSELTVAMPPYRTRGWRTEYVP